MERGRSEVQKRHRNGESCSAPALGLTQLTRLAQLTNSPLRPVRCSALDLDLGERVIDELTRLRLGRLGRLDPGGPFDQCRTALMIVVGSGLAGGDARAFALARWPG